MLVDCCMLLESLVQWVRPCRRTAPSEVRSFLRQEQLPKERSHFWFCIHDVVDFDVDNSNVCISKFRSPRWQLAGHSSLQSLGTVT